VSGVGFGFVEILQVLELCGDSAGSLSDAGPHLEESEVLGLLVLNFLSSEESSKVLEE
jgi:hypothetical protein